MASRGRFLFAKAAEMQFIDVLLVTLVGVGLTAGTTFSGVGTTTESGKQAEADICTLSPMAPNETKSCLAFIVKYTYNATEGKCMTYVYGGCGGTANLFDSEAQCIATCPKKDAILQDSVDEGTESKDSKEACNQPLSSGPCFGFFRKFGFNSETGRCEWFVYGGCQGNNNNFNSARKCQDTCGGSEPLTDFHCEKKNCDWNLWGHYQAKNCKPVYERGECCPTRFECPENAPTSEPSCRYKGKTYSISEPMPEVTEHEPCLASCFCSAGYPDPGSAKATCAHVECPDLFGPPLQQGCRRLYDSMKTCCSSSTKCNVTETDFLCEFEGRQYVDGERIYPRDRTKTCLCNQAFVDEGGVDSSACRAVECGWESNYQHRLDNGCTPVYFNQGTCPIDWVCPGDKGEKVDSLSWEKHGEENKASDDTAADVVPQERPTANNVCLQPKQAGNCDALVPSFYYNAFTGKCEEFNYGGCQGNENRFKTSEECESACQGSPNGCTLDPERGRCRGRFPSWHFDTATGACKSFFYGGCGGNQNNFKSRELCETQCAKSSSSSSSSSSAAADEAESKSPADHNHAVTPHAEEVSSNISDVHIPEVQIYIQKSENSSKEVHIPVIRLKDESTDDVPNSPQFEARCTLQLNRGRCYAYMPRYFFNMDSKKCEKFIYGGCLGNGNNFRTFAECNAACSGTAKEKDLMNNAKDTQETMPSIQGLQVAVVEKGEVIPTARIEKLSEGEVEEDICSLPVEKGRCMGSFRRFYYDPQKAACVGFFFGGCKGNANNFISIQQCLDKCAPRRTKLTMKPGVCYQPVQPGPCKASIKRYYYDPTNGFCKEFNYGGCKGNRNKFSKLQTCVKACSGQDRPDAQQVNQRRKTEIIDPCLQPVVKGPCRMFFKQYFFSARSGKCSSFFYGGCLGNDNRFPTEDACVNACEKRQLVVKGSDGEPLRCSLGQETFNLSSGFLPESNKCYECRCSTPPELTCREMSHACPASPGPDHSPLYTAGKCCPEYVKSDVTK